MTGTPISRDMRDLHHLFRILSVDPWYNSDWWEHLIETPCQSSCALGASPDETAVYLFLPHRCEHMKEAIKDTFQMDSFPISMNALS